MIGDNIKKYREKIDMTQSDLAESLFVTRQAISNWERGKTEPDLDTIQKIADILGVSKMSLISYNDDYDVDKMSLRILRSVNILLIASHIFLSVKKGISFMPLLIAPATIFLIVMIMSIVFINSFKTGDFSIIAGFDPRKDTVSKTRKQLYYILLLSLILSIASSIFYYCVYATSPDKIILSTMIILFSFIIGLFIVVFTVSKKVK